MSDAARSAQANPDERRWTAGSWLTLSLAVIYLFACLLYILAALQQPSEGWHASYDETTGWVIDANQGGAHILRLGDRINAIDGFDVDIVLGPRYELPPGWEVGGTARYTVVREGQTIELDVPLVRRPDRELLRFLQPDPTIFGLLLSLMVAAGIFWLRPDSIVVQLLLLVLIIFFGSLGVYNASWSPAMFLFPPLLHTASLIITPWALMYAMVAHLALSFPLRAWPLTRWPRLAPGILYVAALIDLSALLVASMTAYLVLFSMLLSVMLVALIGAPIYHLRTTADPITRAQIGWAALGLGASFGITLLGAMSQVFAPGLTPLLDWLTSFGWVLLPVCLGIAITRYRLFDIDVIIRRTLVYTVLTLILGAMYLLSVVGLQVLFVRLTGQESTLAVVASTLALAALFRPLRAGVQAFIDRRFFRRKYNAAHVISAFARRAQSEADLPALATDLLGVVQETIEPDRVRLWLTKDEKGDPRQP